MIHHVRVNEQDASLAQEKFMLGAVASYAFSQVGFETYHMAAGQTAMKFNHNKNMSLRPNLLIMTLISKLRTMGLDS